MAETEKQTEPIASAWMFTNGAAVADFLLLKEQI
jgi:hypothetical protein